MGDHGRKFVLTEEHIKLLRNANISWDSCEYGAPCIDPKRPYGNGDVLRDMAKILECSGGTCPHCGEPIDEQDTARLEDLHLELENALQIFVKHATIELGAYYADPYSSDWKKR